MPAPSPADESGYCLTTLHNIGTVNGTTSYIAVSPDGAYLYRLHSISGGTNIDRVDLSTYAVTSGWIHAPGSFWYGLTVDASGNLYTTDLTSNPPLVIAKITPAGVVTDPWVTCTGYDEGTGGTAQAVIAYGRDANLYVSATVIGPGDPTVLQITLTGTVTELTALTTTTDVGYDGVACASDGTVWVSLNPPPAASPYYNIDSTLRRYRPGVPDVTDIPIQGLVNLAADAGSTEVIGGIFCDAADHIFALMSVFFPSIAGTNVLTTTDQWHTTVGAWTFTGITGTWAGLGQVDVQTPTSNPFTVELPSSYSVAGGTPAEAQVGVLVNTGSPLAASIPVTAWLTVSGVPIGPGRTTTVTSAMALTQVSTHEPDEAYIMPSTANVGILLSFNVPSPVGGGFVKLQAPLLNAPAPYLNPAWFLRVTPSGVATRVASTWGHSGSPPPVSTSTNSVDGPLGTSLATYLRWGAGITTDGITLYSVDDSNIKAPLGAGIADLLRTLALCKPSGMLWLSDASPVGPANGLWTSGRRLHS